MEYLAAGLVLVGALGLLNLLLSVGIIRRLRSDEAARAEAAALQGGVMLPAGAEVRTFTTTTTDGEPVSRADLAGGADLVGFFSVRCGPCRTLLPRFAEAASTWTGGRAHVLAVVVDGEGGAGDFVERLLPVARVVVEAERGPVASAFGVRGFPAYCVVDGGGTVRASGHSLDELAALQPA
jgi:thiol-disulfide isomerase/thioredoxin